MSAIRSIMLIVIGCVIFYFFLSVVLFSNVEKLNNAREEELEAITYYCEGMKKVNAVKMKTDVFKKIGLKKDPAEAI